MTNVVEFASGIKIENIGDGFLIDKGNTKIHATSDEVAFLVTQFLPYVSTSVRAMAIQNAIMTVETSHMTEEQAEVEYCNLASIESTGLYI